MSTKYPQGLITGTPPYTTGNFSGVWTPEQLAQKYYFFGDGVANSLRFRSSASAYLSRTPASAGNQKTWTWSAWVKRGILSTGNARLLWGGNSTTDGFALTWTSTDTLYVWNYAASTTTLALTTTAVFRDPSSWYHIVLAVDTTQATDVNRVRLYVNGVQYTFGTTTWCAQNTNLLFNAANQNTIGYSPPYGGYFDGYMADINFIDGQALDPSYFGVVAPATGVWSPKRYAGTYGLNGFYLNFSNGTSTTTLGYDASGNSNNWTTNNISLTAGSTYDWMIDSPTPYAGSSYGVGNYCVLMPFTVCNAISPGYGTSSASDGNLNYSSVGSVSNSWSSFALPASGKYYAEMRFASLNTATTGILAYDGNINRSVLFYQNGTIYNNNGLSQSLTAWSSGDTIGFAISMDASTIQFYRNGSAVGTAESITVSYGQYFIFSRYNAALEANFGQRPFSYTPPSGYKSLCSFNLPGPTINNGASYFAATTYTGTGATQSLSNAVNGVSFQPDFVWIKNRSGVTDHILTDSVRGVTKTLFSDLASAELTVAGALTAFNTGGFQVGYDGTIIVNASSNNYVGWQWKASNATAVSNTAGSITSQVSANTTAGFSVVTWTGTAANATVGHGLGVAPSMVICKSRATAGTNWGVWHSSLSSYAYFLLLNSTAAQATVANAMQALPSSTVLSLGGSSIFNDSGNMVAYCFAAIAGYSAFGSYTGNGSADGPFVYCGFRPKFVMCKNSGAAGSWVIDDSSRDPYNVAGNTLFPNSSAAESASNVLMDMLSNGFKLRGVNVNDSGNTFIYAAFAENPFKYSLAR